jgi:hypothetical protein
MTKPSVVPLMIFLAVLALALVGAELTTNPGSLIIC